ncbi:MAG: DedA family protein [Betaproteobacteria bacterium]|nr:DedA family protein [Betaproteobacteria bacterium]
MESLMPIMNTLLGWLQNPETLIASVGLIGLTIIIFAETGLLIGFFLPGDSLLFSADLFAAGGHLDIWSMAWLLTAAAILGDATGYWIGRKLGHALYDRPDSMLFKRKHLDQTRDFYEKHGGKTIILARYIPIVRTFAPTVAGVAGMSYKSFAAYNVIGGFVWIWSLLFAGFLLGRSVPGIKDYIHVIVVGIVILSVLPIAVKWWKSRSSETNSALEETN